MVTTENYVLLPVDMDMANVTENVKVNDPDKNINVYKSINELSTACDNKSKTQIEKILKNLNLETTCDAKNNEEFQNFKIKHLTLIMSKAYGSFKKDVDILFFSAATFDLDKLQTILERHQNEPDIINQRRYSNSVLLFVLKYADFSHKHFGKCIKILIENGVNVSVFDNKGKTALDCLAIQYKFYKSDPNTLSTVKTIVELLLEKGVFKPDEKATEEFFQEMNLKDTFIEMDIKTRLFYLISKNKFDEFIATLKTKHSEDYVNSNDGENTLLQLASKKSVKVVEHLLKLQADPNLTVPNGNDSSPLELAGRFKKQDIFEILLKYEKTIISETQYRTFVKLQFGTMKRKFFEKILESDKIDINFRTEKGGNTPLHYAIRFSYKNAIQNLLKRGASLSLENNLGDCALDIIDSKHLERYFDQRCIALDYHCHSLSDKNYKIKFRFQCLIEEDPTLGEVNVLSKMVKKKSLEDLLVTHPFIHTFIMLKWFYAKQYFFAVSMFQFIIFSLLSGCFYHFSNITSIVGILCLVFFVINIIFKIPLFLCFRMENKKICFPVLKHELFHGLLEILSIVTMSGSFFLTEIRAFVFLQMAILFLLTIGHHPKLSKWSLMLQQIFKSFIILSMFFSLIVLAFSLGFNILFPNDKLFKNFFTSLFRTFIMTTGEFNINETNNENPIGFSGCFLFFLFAFSMSLVVVNFLIGVAVNDIDKIEKSSKISAMKNVLNLILFVESIYSNKFCAKVRRFLQNPFLFLEAENSSNCTEKYEVDFFINNKEKQFSKINFLTKMDKECLEKIRGHYYKMSKKREQES